ncbi:hypothetical protein RJ55_05491 [Drechmeria coniospora]|nr:hypothetical protein RJ55_05491 [Drechmeria coniospora]
MWDESEAFERERLPAREPRDSNWRGYRAGSRERAAGDRSPGRRYTDRDADRGRGGRGDRDRYRDRYRGRDDDDRDRDRDRDRARGWDRRDDRFDPRDHRDYRHRGEDKDSPRRRSASPPSSPPPVVDLPSRSRPPDQQQTSRTVGNRPRSPSPRRRKHSRTRHNGPSSPGGTLDAAADEADADVDPDVAAMQAMMGFGGFSSTKGKMVAGNDSGTVRKEKKSEYRQYMNRQGGFNRPLSPSR